MDERVQGDNEHERKIYIKSSYEG